MSEWENEPNEFEAENIYILRHPNMKHLCGYVGVPEGHPFHSTDYDSVYEKAEINVHGGLTYAEDHKPGKEPDGLWWFGFDCAHAGDRVPGLPLSFDDDVYRDFEYVKSECLALARELARAAV